MLRRVLILAFDRSQALDVVGPLDVFAGARQAHARRRARDPGYEPVVAGVGREVASLIARFLVVFMRRAGGQSQFSPPLQAQAAERPPLKDLQAWIVEHPEAPLDVPALAKRVAMSERHFSRVFHAEVGLSPAAFVERVRVDAARRLLETSRERVDAVAAHAGFGTSEALRRAMGRQVGLSPREYRARFGAPSPGGMS